MVKKYYLLVRWRNNKKPIMQIYVSRVVLNNINLIIHRNNLVAFRFLSTMMKLMYNTIHL